jgi:hypothetical protein
MEQALKGKVWVNIVDLVDCAKAGTKVKRHANQQALSRYTRSSEGKIFPKKTAKKNPFLRALLITL